MVASEFGDVDCMVMQKIDSAELIHKDGVIKTPFGVTSIESLSTGCKAVLLLYRYFVKHGETVMLSVIECGTNALNVLFSLPQSDIVKLYLTNRTDLYKCSLGEFLIDDTKFVERLSHL